MNLSNQDLAKIFREVAAAYTIKSIGNIFQIRAYENVADSIEHSTAEIQDLWEEGKLDQISDLGEKIRGYLDELFTQGHVKHFQDVKKGIPEIVFELLHIPGIGPKTAMKIADLQVKNIEDLKEQIKSGELVKKGFSGKIAEKIMDGLNQVSNREGRMLLPYALAHADAIVDYLKQLPDVLEVHTLGSLRRMVATIGDLDFAVASNNAKKVIAHFCRYPNVVSVINQGEQKASVMLKSGIRADLLVGEPDSYGALLQHFTGSKNHNIHLRTLAEKKGLSLSEYGVRLLDNKRQVTSNKLIQTKTEEEFYQLLGMQVPPPEIREDVGEIESSIKHTLPRLVEYKDIKGDFHLHSNFPLEPSHGPGVNAIQEIVQKGKDLGYVYMGISDHSPSLTNHSKEDIIRLIEKRTKFIHTINMSNKNIRVLNGLEVDILKDGDLSVPDEALKMLDYCIAGIHSGHRGSKEEITKRLLAALSNPYVTIISHPTNRLLNERDSSEADWDTIFKFCVANHKILEINAFPNRLDLRDDLVRNAKAYGVKFIIDTDAHEVSQMENMRFGVAVARRGWATKEDIVNTWDFSKLKQFFNAELIYV